MDNWELETQTPVKIPEIIHAPIPQLEDDEFIDKKSFIEDQFMIRAKEEEGELGYIVPFHFNEVQERYYTLLMSDYTKLDGAREIILKARQQGFSSLILALFTVDFITRPNSVSICISYKSDATKRLFRKVRFYIESYCQKNGFRIEDYLSMDTREELQNGTNGAYFYIGTAGSKVGGHGDTATNVHFSEAAFYEDTDKITAKEIIEATIQQVPQNHGMIFVESTGSTYGTYYQKQWELAKQQLNNFKPRFFSCEEFYSPDWLAQKAKDYLSEDEFRKDYPRNETEAFLYSGSPYFSRDVLRQLTAGIQEPALSGRLAADGFLF